MLMLATSTAESAYDFPVRRISTIIQGIYNGNVTRVQYASHARSVKGVCNVNRSHYVVSRDYYHRHPLISRLALSSCLGEEQKRRKGTLDESFETFWYISSPYSADCDDFNNDFNNIDGKKNKKERERRREKGRENRAIR